MITDRRLESRILIVDDEAPNVKLLERVLARAGYINVKSITDSREAVSLFSQWQPDLILCDLHMPHMDGFDVMEQLGLRSQATYVPLIVLTADANTKVRKRALEMGATDFLLKPFDHTEVLLRIRNVLHTRLLNLGLEDRVRERTQELDEARHEVLERLALAAEYRDDDTHQHTWRVGQMSTLLAQLIGLGEIEVELIGSAAPLHDVGKIGISDLILLKPNKLTLEEFEIMKTHTTIGVKILSGSAHSVLQLAAEIALTHHERWDGTGYLRELKGEEIPLAGRIVAVADVFDALTHDRPYKKAWSVPEAMAEIGRMSGRQFDPDVVAAFERLYPEISGLIADPRSDSPSRSGLPQKSGAGRIA